MTKFREFVADLIREHGTGKAVADLIEMSLSAFLRGVNREGTLSVENCLKLAEAVGESPSRVLQLAGKGQVAALIERLYGATRAPLSALDRQFVALDIPTKRHLVRLVRDLSATRKR